MKTESPLLGVNIDHIATIRQARDTDYPSPLAAALEAERGGADGITVHLREDRRHIQDRDVAELKEKIATRLNLEMALTDEMIAFALRIKPAYVCLVPEKRRELTTEGGLDVAGDMAGDVAGKVKVAGNKQRIRKACETFAEAGILVSLFTEPEPKQMEAAHAAGAPFVELHTGAYANAADNRRDAEIHRLLESAKLAAQLGLTVNAGHGLHYDNVRLLIDKGAGKGSDPRAGKEVGKNLFYELNIGHSIVARALFAGIRTAVREMRDILRNR